MKKDILADISMGPQMVVVPTEELSEDDIMLMASKILWNKLITTPILDTPSVLHNFLSAQMGPLEEMTFACLFLSQNKQVLAFRPLFYGTIHEVIVHPRIIVVEALKCNAAQVVLCRNEPATHPDITEADHAEMVKLRDALELIDVVVLDYLIVGPVTVASFAEYGAIG